MRTRILGVTIIAALALAACSSDDDGGGSSPQDEAAVLFVDAMGEDDIAVDLDCAKEAASGMSDEDAQALVDAGVDAEAEPSPGGNEFLAKATSCIDVDSLVALFGEELLDGDCLEEVLKDVDPADLESGDLFPPRSGCLFLGIASTAPTNA